MIEAGFDVTSDGTRLLARLPTSTGPVQHGVIVVLNWFSEFAARK